MRYFYKVADAVPTAPLMDALTRHPELWDENNIRTTFEGTPHAQVNDILLRFGELGGNERFTGAAKIGDNLLASDLPALAALPQSKQIALDLMRLLGGTQLGRLIITKLEPGKKILPHADTMGAYSKFYKRYTLMLQCLPGCTYTCGDETVQMKTGEMWYVDVSAEHMVANNSSDDRIVMLIDIHHDT